MIAKALRELDVDRTLDLAARRAIRKSLFWAADDALGWVVAEAAIAAVHWSTFREVNNTAAGTIGPVVTRAPMILWRPA